jgi:hypothetical protein
MDQDAYFYTNRDDVIEREMFALITAHVDKPGPFIMWLADRLASHEIVVRLRLVPARSFSESCLRIASSLRGDA